MNLGAYVLLHELDVVGAVRSESRINSDHQIQDLGYRPTQQGSAVFSSFAFAKASRFLSASADKGRSSRVL